jgi:adenylate kinase
MATQPELVLIFGGPGAGKGTQGQLLSGALGVPHISSGDLLRAQHREVDLMRRGDLLPDELVSDIVLSRLQRPDAAPGAILDGFPRTLAQAQRLDRWLVEHRGTLRGAVYLDVPRDELVARMVARGDLSQRSDDREGVADRRVDVFLRELPPVLEHYATRGLLRRVDGTRAVDEVQRQIVEVLATPGA